MTIDVQAIRQKIESALISEEYDVEQSKVTAFHMTDWASDFQRLEKFFRDPSSFNDEETEALLMDFLIHVPNHLAAASKVMLEIPVTDVFDVGATTEAKDAN